MRSVKILFVTYQLSSFSLYGVSLERISKATKALTITPFSGDATKALIELGSRISSLFFDDNYYMYLSHFDSQLVFQENKR